MKRAFYNYMFAIHQTHAMMKFISASFSYINPIFLCWGYLKILSIMLKYNK